jgi:outer membrane lipoprotein-sorting protein
MKKLILILIMFSAVIVNAQTPTGEEILKKVDANLTSETKIVQAKMIIHGRRGSRTIESKSWILGAEKSFSEYMAPAREKGTKMLKLSDQLWMFSPSTDRIIKISGHMLRQSVMGSDLSYEDMMEDPVLSNIYTVVIVGEESVLDRPCWLLELKARKKDVAYFSRKLWIDKERFLPLKEELFAKSGKLLKKVEIKEIVRKSNRWVANRVVFKDVLKKGKGTEFEIVTIEFDKKIPAYIFSKAALKK